jgi:Ca2+-binding RTX toxin-like protein
LIHEIGHTLGLEHPFENNDGDVVDGITDPWKSLYPEDTVMAYRSPANGSWPNDYTSNDKTALIELWGLETTPSPPAKFDTPNGLSAQVMDSNLSRFKGTSQADWIIGNIGNNIIKARRGNDYIQGGSGNDRLNGNNGNDTLRGEDGDDIIHGGKGSDIIIGDRGNDYICGSRGNDYIQGGSGNDRLNGNNGNDTLRGGDGDDIIHGGKGSDIIHGGRGADVLYGNSGQNTFSNAADGSIDIINIECEQQSSKKRRGKAKNKKQVTNNIDIIEELDANDQIYLIGAKNKSILIQETSALGETGIGIFAKGSLEVLYIGIELSSAQLLSLTTGLNK